MDKKELVKNLECLANVQASYFHFCGKGNWVEVDGKLKRCWGTSGNIIEVSEEGENVNFSYSMTDKNRVYTGDFLFAPNRLGNYKLKKAIHDGKNKSISSQIFSEFNYLVRELMVD